MRRSYATAQARQPCSGRFSGAVLEAPALVPGLDDVAVVGEPVEERGGHLGVAEDARPLPEGEVGGDDHRGALVEAADQVEQQLAAGLGERQVTEFVEDDEVQAGEMIGDAALAAGAGLGLELVDEVDDVEEAAPGAAADAGPRDGDGGVGLAGAGGTNRILPDIRVARRRSTIRSTRAAASGSRSSGAIGSAGPGCWSSGSMTERWRRFPRGCARRPLRRCPCGSVRGSR